MARVCHRRNYCFGIEMEFRKKYNNPKDQFGTLARGAPQIEQLHKPVDTTWTAGEEIWQKEAKKAEQRQRLSRDAFANAKQITLPFAVHSAYVRKIEAKKQALENYKKSFGIDKTARVVIECSRSEFNHYEGQRYSSKNIPLVSQYWDKSKYKNEWFIIKRTQKEALCLHHSTPTSWQHYTQDLNSQLLQNIQKSGFHAPTSVQKSVLEMFHARPHLFIAAETGSGKTLAYAAPILSHLVEQKKQGFKHKVIILTVSHLLVQQIHAAITSLSANTDLNIIAVDSSSEADNLVFDLLVGQLLDVNRLLKSTTDPPRVSFVVMDEADILLSENYVKIMTDFLSLVPVTNSKGDDLSRLVFVAATCPDELQSIVEEVVDNEQLFYIRSDYLHKPLPNIEQTFIRVREMDKVAKLKEILDKDSESEGSKTMVFCKDRRTATFLDKSLSSYGFITNLLIKYNASVEAYPKANVLISTNAGSRGMDIANLKHVINYDFPWHISDFLHRVGRVGRCSENSRKMTKSRVTSFVRTTEEVRTVQAIETAIRFGKPLENVELKSSVKYQKAKYRVIKKDVKKDSSKEKFIIRE